ncbi:hypothetical protein EKH79_04765 [Dyella dinghuensis]|uniref:DUF4760 domain-containing protein n=1 Tax=Dyella dinghuensis TaxID=1920169 RepID=A0A3S0QYJ5_9GAMM|nr:hypothetical protein [Dyella dinghuensis]RUL66011.1 hypothetical protein EKH79_04765 [Dyella dinghuensis]
MKAYLYRWATTHIGACAIGILIGCAVFHLPQFACGPFRTEQFPIWLAGIGGIAAAIATFQAAWAALHSASIERTDKVRELKLKQQAIASAYLNPIYVLASNGEAWKILAKDSRITLYNLARRLAIYDTSMLDSLLSKIDIFDANEARIFGQAYTMINFLSLQAKAIYEEIPKWPDPKKQQQRDFLVSELTDLADYARHAWLAFNKLGEDQPPLKDPVVHGQEYAARELSATT